jgi:hypothetical protein
MVKMDLPQHVAVTVVPIPEVVVVVANMVVMADPEWLLSNINLCKQYL